MLLFDVNKKMDDLLVTFINSLDKEGIEGFFKDQDAIKKHLQIEEKDIKELNEESAVFFRNKNFENAVQALAWLTFFEPLNADHFLRLGAVFLSIQEYDAAIKTLADGFLLDPHNPYFPLYIGHCFKVLGNLSTAKIAFEESLKLSKDNLAYKAIFTAAQEALLL